MTAADPREDLHDALFRVYPGEDTFSRLDDAVDAVLAYLEPLLMELEDLREQLADRIVPVENTDTVVHLQDLPIDYGLPLNAVVRFATGPDAGDYVQVHAEPGGEGWVHVTAWPGLDIRPAGSGVVHIRPVRP